jgi:hypothetical protein
MNTNVKWTKEQMRRFDLITLGLSSPNQLRRIKSRLALKVFQDEHGEELCRAMFEELKRRDAEKESR